MLVVTVNQGRPRPLPIHVRWRHRAGQLAQDRQGGGRARVIRAGYDLDHPDDV